MPSLHRLRNLPIVPAAFVVLAGLILLATGDRLAAAVALAAAIGAYAAYRMALRQCTRVLDTARAVAEGDYAARVGGRYGGGLLGELARGFDRMLDVVARRERELQEREEWFRSVVQHSTDMIAIVDGTGS